MPALRIRFAWLAKPKNLLLLDFVGALGTALFTGLLLTTVLPTGLPQWILVALSITAAGFACFDLIAYCYWPNECWPLTIVGLLNLSYCVATIIISSVNFPLLTAIGMSYFALESAIVIPLAAFELMIARKCRCSERTDNPSELRCASAA